MDIIRSTLVSVGISLSWLNQYPWASKYLAHLALNIQIIFMITTPASNHSFPSVIIISIGGEELCG